MWPNYPGAESDKDIVQVQTEKENLTDVCSRSSQNFEFGDFTFVSPLNLITTLNVIPTVNVAQINANCNTNRKCNRI